jgi:hypothetical protein
MTADARSILVVGVTTVVLLLAGCATSPRKPEPAGAPATGASAVTVRPSTTVGASSAGSLERKDVPPEGVAAQAKFFLGAGDGSPECVFQKPLPQSRTPYLTLPRHVSTTIEVFAATEICLVGFTPNRRATISAKAPDGNVEQTEIMYRQYSIGYSHSYKSDYQFAGLPSDPVGRYVIEARQGSLKAGITLTLVPTSKPMQRVLYENYHPSAVGLSGFARRQNIAVRFYGGHGPFTAANGTYLLPYVGTAVVSADGNGQATYPWPKELMTGSYGVLADGVPLPQPVIRAV